jgi:hypothetical protein
MVDCAEMFMQQSSLDDNYDAAVNKLQKIHKVYCPKKKLLLLKRGFGSLVLLNLEKCHKTSFRKLKIGQDDILRYKNHLKKI